MGLGDYIGLRRRSLPGLQHPDRTKTDRVQLSDMELGTFAAVEGMLSRDTSWHMRRLQRVSRMFCMFAEDPHMYEERRVRRGRTVLAWIGAGAVVGAAVLLANLPSPEEMPQTYSGDVLYATGTCATELQAQLNVDRFLLSRTPKDLRAKAQVEASAHMLATAQSDGTPCDPSPYISSGYIGTTADGRPVRSGLDPDKVTPMNHPCTVMSRAIADSKRPGADYQRDELEIAQSIIVTETLSRTC